MNDPTQAPVWQVATDTGGTFTDCIAINTATGCVRTSKVLSNSAVRGVIERASPDGRLHISQTWNAQGDFVGDMELCTLGDEPGFRKTARGFDPARSILTVDAPLGDELVAALPGRAFELRCSDEAPLLAARVAIGRPQQDGLGDVALRIATTRATNALLERSYQSAALITNEGHADMLRIGTQQRPDIFALDIERPEPAITDVFEISARLDTAGNIVQPLHEDELRSLCERICAGGFSSVAIALMHSDISPSMELDIEKQLRRTGIEFTSCSHRLAPFVGLLARAQTASINAAVEPVFRGYLDSISRGMRRAADEGQRCDMLVLNSAGGLASPEDFHAKDGLLSGPAGGVIGAAHVARSLSHDRAIAFDMGGTSTDVSRVIENNELTFEHQINGMTVLSPSLDIKTVAAGGGSICSYQLGRLCVGPASAGAAPGPACYGEGGPLTLTDVNLLLGRVDSHSFGIPIDIDASRRSLSKLIRTIEAESGESIEDGDLLEGLVSIADERMAAAIRSVTARRGHDPGDHAMVAFGGAGGQHACGVADRLGIRTVIVPARAGVLSAVGLANASLARIAELQILQPLKTLGGTLPSIANELGRSAVAKVEAVQFDGAGDVRVTRRMVSMRLAGQNSTIECDWPESAAVELLAARFADRYTTIFGYAPDVAHIEVVSVRVIASARAQTAPDQPDGDPEYSDAAPERWVDFQCAGEQLTAGVYARRKMMLGNGIPAPALVIDESSTTVIPPGWSAQVGPHGAIVMQRELEAPASHAAGRPEAIEQELFTSRLEGIAEEMGHSLARTAVSTNVKERLDFSCAILDAHAQLIANAPHMPVHLGSLGQCARDVLGEVVIGPGDVVITNHPKYGGSHLPDITLISGVFDEHGEVIAYVSNRAHHAEIGGETPGSMPADATTLAQEGIVINPRYLVRGGKPQWESLRLLLESQPHPSRAVEENLADVRAQLAANELGASRVRALVHDYLQGAIAHRMERILSTAEHLLIERLSVFGQREFGACETLDDGSTINLTIHTHNGRAVFDFAGSAGVHPTSLNATPAIVRSAVLYVLRLLVNEPIPLNEGLMRAIDLRIPQGMLDPPFDPDPSRCPAVAGGNVETSQRIVDTLIGALGLAACGQGTMNNVTVGSDTWGFYETICGGAGATKNSPGAHAVHTHMTNTRITDAEILERRYPVRLESFQIRTGSGGLGSHPGGDGSIRRMRFNARAIVSMLTQHRAAGPYGIEGGSPGQVGRQLIERADGRIEVLPPTARVEVSPGDTLVVETPGGGGWGEVVAASEPDNDP